jgi:dihydrofolate reductase
MKGARDRCGARTPERTMTVRKLSANTFLSLDGVMQAPGSPTEDTEGGFTVGGWSMSYWDDLMGQAMGEAMSTPTAMVLGRRTYEIFASYWPHASEEEGASMMNGTTKYVASRTLSGPLEWENSHLIEGDAVEGLAKLKAEDGPDLNITGSSRLIQSLLPANLIDEFHIWIYPVVVGSGKRLFDEGAVPMGMKLVDSKVATTGVILTTYVPDGEIGYKGGGPGA